MSKDRTDQIIPLGVENPDAQRARGLFAWLEEELPEEMRESAALAAASALIGKMDEREP